MRRLETFDLCRGLVLVSLFCAGCGGGGGSNDGNSPPPPAAHAVGGSVSGLDGGGLMLRLNGGIDLAVGASGNFAFATRLAEGSAYTVTVATQPSDPSQTCVPGNATGTVGSANVSNVTVTCTTNVYSIGGMISGLTGSGLALGLNGATAFAVAAGDSFEFPTRIRSGEAYAVTIATQPQNPEQHCAIAGGAGTVDGQDVRSIQIACIDLAGTVGGTVTGLTGSGLELRNNGGDALMVTANGSFRFDSAVAVGGSYSVTVAAQPRVPRQICAVMHATGSTGSSPVTSVSVECVLHPGNLRTSVPEPNYSQGGGEQLTFNSLNSARSGGGFGLLAQDVNLDAAARAHARYLAEHFFAAGRFDPETLSAITSSGVIGAHSEAPGSPSFTGALPEDRARAAGYAWIEGEEAAIFNVGTASRDCSDQVLDSVDLRHRIMNAAMRDIGIGISGTTDGKGFVCVILAAYADFRGEAPAGWLGIYPFDSAGSISLAMASDATGDTFGSNRGMPIMFLGDRDAPMSLTVTMRNITTQAVIHATTVTVGSLQPGLASGSSGTFAIPSIYLEPDTGYSIHAAGTVEGLSVDQTTTFATGGRSRSAPFVPELAKGTLRAIYAYPTDRTESDEYRQAVQVSIEHLQGWFQQQLGGETFSIYGAQPEVCALPRDSSYYLDESWTRIQTDIQSCVPAGFGDPDHDWVIFADVVHGCDLPGYLDAGGDTLAMLQRSALEGLAGRDAGFDACGRPRTKADMARWIGLVGHEIGHTLGLPHPCDTYQAGCDVGSLMWEGPLTYPAAYFAAPERAILRSHHFINAQRFGR